MQTTSRFVEYNFLKGEDTESNRLSRFYDYLASRGISSKSENRWPPRILPATPLFLRFKVGLRVLPRHFYDKTPRGLLNRRKSHPTNYRVPRHPRWYEGGKTDSAPFPLVFPIVALPSRCGRWRGTKRRGNKSISARASAPRKWDLRNS